MSKILTLFCALLIAGNAADGKTVENFSFMEGFIFGIDTDLKHPGPCIKAIIGLSDDFYAIGADIFKIYIGVDEAVNKLSTDITRTVYDIHSLNYNSDIYALKNCSANTYNCGKAAAMILRDITGWDLKVSHVVDPSFDLYSFINGLITGLEKNGKHTCSTRITQYNRHSGEWLYNILAVVRGDFSLIPNSLINFMKAMSDYKRIESSCDFDSFIDDFMSTMTLEGYSKLVMRVILNYAKILDFTKTYNTCEANPTRCGLKLGQLMQLLLDTKI